MFVFFIGELFVARLLPARQVLEPLIVNFGRVAYESKMLQGGPQIQL